jgi:hypothetical protein
VRRILILLVATALITAALVMSGLGAGPAIAAKGGPAYVCTNGTDTVTVHSSDKSFYEKMGYTCTKQ